MCPHTKFPREYFMGIQFSLGNTVCKLELLTSYHLGHGENKNDEILERIRYTETRSTLFPSSVLSMSNKAFNTRRYQLLAENIGH